jgi:hypothetical protein
MNNLLKLIFMRSNKLGLALTALDFAIGTITKANAKSKKNTDRVAAAIKAQEAKVDNLYIKMDTAKQEVDNLCEIALQVAAAAQAAKLLVKTNSPK